MYKILVLDDEPKIREVIREYAEFSGYEVTEADAARVLRGGYSLLKGVYKYIDKGIDEEYSEEKYSGQKV